MREKKKIKERGGRDKTTCVEEKTQEKKMKRMDEMK